MVFRNVVNRIRRIFPSSLRQWDEYYTLADSILGVERKKGLEMILLDTITTCNLHLCRPIIYYLICHRYTEVIAASIFECLLTISEAN